MKQKVFDYIEELERKAKESKKYFKLWHEEKVKNNKAIEYIDKELCNINIQENIMAKNELLKIKSIIQGDDKE